MLRNGAITKFQEHETEKGVKMLTSNGIHADLLPA
jgi:hypothetical protein